MVRFALAATVGTLALTGVIAAAGGATPGVLRLTVTSPTMEPTLHCKVPAPGCEGFSADVVVVRRPARGPRRGDIVYFRSPPRAVRVCGAGGRFLKRVVGLPGETVSMRRGVVSVNGTRLAEPYIEAERRGHETGRWTVPRGGLFVLGDNRAISCDSSAWGALPVGNVVGTVTRIVR